MSLIKCPECNKEVSDKTKQCIHCGCEFSVCNECGTISLGNLNTCPKCGYEFPKDQEVSHNQSVQRYTEDTLVGLQRKSLDETPVIKFFFNPNTHFLLMFAAIIILIITILTAVFWGGFSTDASDYKDLSSALGDLDDKLEKAANFKKDKEAKQWFFVISAALVTISSIGLNFANYATQHSFEVFSDKYGIDILSFVNKEFSIGFEKIVLSSISERVNSIKLAIGTLMYQSDISQKDNEQKYAITSVLLTVLYTSLLTIWCVINVEGMMINDNWGIFSSEHFWLLIATVIIYFLEATISKANDRKINNAYLVWVKEHIPEHFEAYINYISNFESYVKTAYSNKQ